MFKKPKKKRHFPPGTFIPTRARILAILQLCIVFSVICYNLGTPFLGEVFKVREQQSLYQSIMNSSLFHELSGIQQDAIMEDYQELLAYGHRSIGQKIGEAFGHLLIDMPPFKLAWIFLSVIVPILLLKKVEGARLAVWLLPLVTLLYCLDNHFFYPKQPALEEHQLFPTEEVLTSQYLKKPLSNDLSLQQEELKGAWDSYLVNEWAEENFSEDSRIFQRHVKKGSFNFNIARLKARQNDLKLKPRYEWKQSLIWFALYMVWNLYFAIAVTISLKSSPERP
jgi:hypothetical protein